MSMGAVGSPRTLWSPGHWPALLLEMPLWASPFLGSDRHCGFQKPLWGHTLDIQPTVQPPSGFCLCSTWGPLS